MNAERLHAIALEIQKELKITNQVQLVNQLVQHLQNQVNQPNQPIHQQNVSNTLKILFDKLKSAPSNNFPPTWRQIIKEIEADHLLGENLLRKIEDIFTRNQITPSIALEEIKKIQQSLQNFSNAINNLIAAFKQLNIGADELEPGECEFSILVPRKYVNNELKEFGKELEELNQIFGVFAEIATGSRPGFEIRQISSTDLSVFLNVDLQTAECITVAIASIISAYKNLLEIKKLRNELKNKGVPEDNLQGIEDYANNLMNKEIEKLMPDLINKFYKSADEKRKNELIIELRYSLKKIANRIDRNFNFEVRVKPPKEEEEAQEKGEQNVYSRILKSAKELTFLKEEGEPILSLPECEDNSKTEK